MFKISQLFLAFSWKKKHNSQYFVPIVVRPSPVSAALSNMCFSIAFLGKFLGKNSFLKNEEDDEDEELLAVGNFTSSRLNFLFSSGSLSLQDN